MLEKNPLSLAKSEPTSALSPFEEFERRFEDFCGGGESNPEGRDRMMAVCGEGRGERPLAPPGFQSSRFHGG
jgi:hypothetical protein